MNANSNLKIEVIERGIELSNEDLSQILGGLGGTCGCKCTSINTVNLCTANGVPTPVEN